MVKISEIPRALIDKLQHSICHDSGGYACTCGASDFNKAISQQGSVELEVVMDREKLAEIIYYTDYRKNISWDKAIQMTKNFYLQKADAICQNKDVICKIVKAKNEKMS